MKEDRKKVGWLLCVFAFSMSIPLFFWFQLTLFLQAIGLGSQAASLGSAWLLAAVIAIFYSYYTVKMVPAIRPYIVEFSWLKLVSIWLAFSAGFLEEIVFRMMLMNMLQSEGFSDYTQVAVSAVGFGVAHACWILLRGEFKIAVPVILSTTFLGVMLGFLYIYSGRNLLPCIAAHIVINLIIEPGLLMSAITGHWRETRKT